MPIRRLPQLLRSFSLSRKANRRKRTRQVQHQADILEDRRMLSVNGLLQRNTSIVPGASFDGVIATFNIPYPAAADEGGNDSGNDGNVGGGGYDDGGGGYDGGGGGYDGGGGGYEGGGGGYEGGGGGYDGGGGFGNSTGGYGGGGYGGDGGYGGGGYGGDGGDTGGGSTPEDTRASQEMLSFHYVAEISWDDGLETAGFVRRSEDNPHLFEVITQRHFSVEPGDAENFVAEVTVHSLDGSGAAVNSTISVQPPSIDGLGSVSILGRNLDAVELENFSGTIATFTDTRTNTSPSDYAVTVDWGVEVVDAGSTSTNADVLSHPDGSFRIEVNTPVRFAEEASTTPTISVQYLPTQAAAVGYSSLIVSGAPIIVSVPDQTWSYEFTEHIIATFDDPTPGYGAETFEAHVIWGDGQQDTIEPKWNNFQQHYEVRGKKAFYDLTEDSSDSEYDVQVRIFEVRTDDQTEREQLASRGSDSGTLTVPDSVTIPYPGQIPIWDQIKLQIFGDSTDAGWDTYTPVIYTAMEQYLSYTPDTIGDHPESAANGESWTAAPISDIHPGETFTKDLGSFSFDLSNLADDTIDIEYYIRWDGPDSPLTGPFFNSFEQDEEFSFSGTHTYDSTGSKEVVIQAFVSWWDDMTTIEDPDRDPVRLSSGFEFSTGAIVAEKMPVVSGGASDISPGQSVYANDLFDASDLADDSLYIIEWGDGQVDIFDFDEKSLEHLSHTYSTVGDYSARITVRQGVLTATAEASVTVTPQTPPSISITGQTIEIEEQQETGDLVLATITDNSPLRIGGSHVVRIDWGDGAESVGVLQAGADASTLLVKGKHTYDSPGLYPIQIYYKSQLQEQVHVVTAKVTAQEFTFEQADLTVGHVPYENLLVGRINRSAAGDDLVPSSHYRAAIDWGDGYRQDAMITGSGDSLYVYAEESAYSTKWVGNPGELGYSAFLAKNLQPRIILESGMIGGKWLGHEGDVDVVHGTAGFSQPVYLGTYRMWMGLGHSGTEYDPDDLHGGYTWSPSHTVTVDWADGTPQQDLTAEVILPQYSWHAFPVHRFDTEVLPDEELAEDSSGGTGGDSGTGTDPGNGDGTPGTGDETEEETGVEYIISEHPFYPDVRISDGLIYELEVRDTVYGQQDSPLTDITLARISASEFSNSGYAVTVDWGDGSVTSGSTEANGDKTTDVLGSHIYTKTGRYDITILLESDGGATRVLRSAAVISHNLSGDADRWAAPVDKSTGEFLLFNVPSEVWNPPSELLNLPPEDRAAALDDFPIYEWFTGVIDWGDGSAKDSATLKINPETFDLEVYGRHTYQTIGNFDFQVTLIDASGTPFRHSDQITVYDHWGLKGHRNTTGFDEGSLEILGQAAYSINTGGISIAHQLDLDFSPGFGHQALVYNSDTTNVQPVVEAELTMGDGLVNAANDFLAEARLFWEGEVVSDWVSFGAEFAYTSLDSVILAAQSTIDVVMSGIYDWEIQVRVDLDGDAASDVAPWLYIADSGSTEVLVRNPEADQPQVPDEIGYYGAGWWMDFQNRLFITDNDLFAMNDNDLVWATGTGGTRTLTIHEDDREPWEKRRLWELDQAAYKARYDSDTEPADITTIRYEFHRTTSGSSNDVGTLTLHLEQPSGFVLPFWPPTAHLFDRPFFEFEDRHQNRMYFDEFGLLIGRASTAGTEEFYLYDDEGRLQTVNTADYSGSTITYSGLYSDKIKSPGNREVTLTMQSGVLQSITDVDSTTRSFGYDNTHTNHIDNVTWGQLSQDFEFDDLKRVTKIDLGQGSAWEIATRESRALADEKALLVLPSAFDATTTDLIPFAAFATVTDPVGNSPGTTTATDGTVSAFAQDEVGRSRYFGKPDGRTDAAATRVWEAVWSNVDDHGNALRYEDPSMVETYTYNDNQQLTSSTLVGVGTRSWEYHPDFAYVSKFTNRNGNSTHSTYWDGTGLLKSTRNDEQTLGTQYAYNPEGLLVTLTDPRGFTTTYSYDNNRRLTGTEKTITLGLEASSASQLIETQTTYDDFGNVLRTTDPLGNTHFTYYDERGRLTGADDPLGLTYSAHSFFPHGPAEEFTQSGVRSKLTLDSRGWQTKVETGVGTTEAQDGQTEYNLDGTVKKTTDAMGLESTYQYDTLDRLISSSSHKGTVEHHYDPQGNVHYTKEELLHRPVRHRNYRFNAQNLVVNEFITDQYVAPIAPGFVGPIQYPSFFSVLYNNEGGVLRQTDSRGNSMATTYDNAERVKTTTDRAGHLTTRFYDESGNVVKMTGPEGSHTEWVYDEANRAYETIQYAESVPHVARTFYNAASQVVATYTPHEWMNEDVFGDGKAATFEYDVRGRITKQTDAEGHEASFDYGAWATGDKNVILSRTDYLGRVDYFDYDGLGRKIQHTNAAGEVFKWKYDDADRVVETEVPAPSEIGGGTLVSTTVYDDMLLKVTENGVDGSTLVTEFDGAGNAIKVTDRRGNVTSYDFDAYNRMHTLHLPATTGPDGSSALAAETWHFEHDYNGNVVKTTDPEDIIVEYEYDPMDRQNKVTQYVTQYDPATGSQVSTAIETSTVYNGLGLAEAMTTPIGTSYSSYDEMGRRLTATNAEQETTEWYYDLDSRVWKVVDPLLNERTYGFDAIGRQTSFKDAFQNETTTSYSIDQTAQTDVVQTTNPDGEARRSSHGPAGVTTTHEYGVDNSGTFDTQATTISQRDSLGYASTFSADRDTETGLEDSLTTYNPVTRTKTITDPEGHDVVQVFDANGNMVSQTDRNGNTTTWYFDERNQMVQKQEPGGVDTTFEYDQLGQVIVITDPEGNTTSFDYDEIGRKVSETNEVGDTRTLDYDSGSRLIRQTDRNERITKYTYDNVDRLLTETWEDASGATIHTITFTWNDLGQMETAVDSFADYHFYEYDENGMLEFVSVDIAGLTDPIEIGNQYDSSARREFMLIYINGLVHATTEYGYDYLGRVEAIEQTGASLKTKNIHIGYEGTGPVNDINRWVEGSTDHELETVFSYYADGTIDDIYHLGDSGGLSFTYYDYDYDPGNRITQWQASDEYDDFTNLKFGTIVGYDALNQVTTADHLNLSDENYSYDQTGNRNSHIITDNNRLVSDGVYTYEHDDEGNRTKRTAISDGAYSTYTWDHRNRLTLVQHFAPNGSLTKTVEYTYDAFNRRVSKKVDETADGTIDEGEFYVYDESPYSDLDDILLTLDLDGDLKRTNLHGTDVDQLFASEDANGNVLWPLTDHQGTVREVVEMSDATDTPEIVETINYGAFGNIVNIEDETGASVAEPTLSATYTGREWDEDAQLFFYRARWYDADTGRFVSEDPMGFAAGDANLSRYVGNGTYNATDPSGLQESVMFNGIRYTGPPEVLWQLRRSNVYNANKSILEEILKTPDGPRKRRLDAIFWRNAAAIDHYDRLIADYNRRVWARARGQSSSTRNNGRSSNNATIGNTRDTGFHFSREQIDATIVVVEEGRAGQVRVFTTTSPSALAAGMNWLYNADQFEVSDRPIAIFQFDVGDEFGRIIAIENAKRFRNGKSMLEAGTSMANGIAAAPENAIRLYMPVVDGVILGTELTSDVISGEMEVRQAGLTGLGLILIGDRLYRKYKGTLVPTGRVAGQDYGKISNPDDIYRYNRHVLTGKAKLSPDDWLDTATRLRDNFKNGNVFERGVLGRLGIDPDTYIKRALESGHIPDLNLSVLGQNISGITDIKDVVDLSKTSQLSAFSGYAQLNRMPFNLIISGRTKTISGPLLKAIQDRDGHIFRFDGRTLVEVSIPMEITGPMRF